MKNSFLGQLNVQLWDRDIVSSNNIIGEHNIDLYPWFLMAYHKDREIKPFQVTWNPGKPFLAHI